MFKDYVYSGAQNSVIRNEKLIILHCSPTNVVLIFTSNNSVKYLVFMLVTSEFLSKNPSKLSTLTKVLFISKILEIIKRFEGWERVKYEYLY